VKLLVHVQSVLKRHLLKRALQSQNVADHVHHVLHAQKLQLHRQQLQLKQHQQQKEALNNVDPSQG
jgi:hypothetical protein